MVNLLQKCFSCNLYTLKSFCPLCQKKTLSPHPPRFSPTDKYGSYRRKQKIPLLKEKGLY